jgi:hypothetical protein
MAFSSHVVYVQLSFMNNHSTSGTCVIERGECREKTGCTVKTLLKLCQPTRFSTLGEYKYRRSSRGTQFSGYAYPFQPDQHGRPEPGSHHPAASARVG